MPGPVSDSYDPEFSTGSNREEVLDALREMSELLSRKIGAERDYILDVVRRPRRGKKIASFTERELRILRFGVERGLESF
jgi:hypothetical protein